MNYKNKYIKYKLNCILLKNKLNQIGGMIVKTIPNSGSKDGMSNQCFWISILDYIKKYMPDLTLSELRGYAGLDDSTKNTMFDTDEERFRISIIILLRFLKRIGINLKIKIYRVNYNGEIVARANAFALNLAGTDLIDDRAAIFDDNDGNIIRIANFGLGHFEFITNIEFDLPIEHYIMEESHPMPAYTKLPKPQHAMPASGIPSPYAPHAMPAYTRPPTGLLAAIAAEERFAKASAPSSSRRQPLYTSHAASSRRLHVGVPAASSSTRPPAAASSSSRLPAASSTSYSDKFVPRVLVGNEYIPLSEIPVDKQGYFNQLNEYILYIEILKDVLNENKKEIRRLKEERDNINKMRDLDDSSKDIFLSQIVSQIVKINENIELIKLDIRKKTEEILTLKAFIYSDKFL